MNDLQKALTGLSIGLSPFGVWLLAAYMSIFTGNEAVWGGIGIGYTVAIILAVSWVVSILLTENKE